jgi:hypothetical protein
MAAVPMAALHPSVFHAIQRTTNIFSTIQVCTAGWAAVLRKRCRMSYEILIMGRNVSV